MSAEQVGERLKMLRESKKWTQQDVVTNSKNLNDCAEIAKVQSISSYENGKNYPSIEALMTLSRLYDVSTDYLLFGEEFNSQRKLTDKDYVRQLVSAADYLNLEIHATYPGEDFPQSYTEYRLILNNTILQGDISQSYNTYVAFLDKWKKLRSAYDGQAIDWNDYESLVTKKIGELPDSIAFIGQYEPLD